MDSRRRSLVVYFVIIWFSLLIGLGLAVFGKKWPHLVNCIRCCPGTSTVSLLTFDLRNNIQCISQTVILSVNKIIVWISDARIISRGQTVSLSSDLAYIISILIRHQLINDAVPDIKLNYIF
jgi:hypothetical protein